MKCYLGIDVGSVSTNIVLINQEKKMIYNDYLRTQGQPLIILKNGLLKLAKANSNNDYEIAGVGTTGSARHLSGVIVGADVIKNEITAHAVAATELIPEASTILEIGGQDSKIIIVRNCVAVDFAMNTVCAAGTGSFLDQQAARLGITIEEFSQMALKAKTPVRIAGRCSVFAESDMIHKQQLGHSLADITAGLCEALVRNYLNNVGKGKEIVAPVVFQGGVAANQGIKAAFEKALGIAIIIPEHFKVMGALGAALLAKEEIEKGKKTRFRGFKTFEDQHDVASFECQDCANSCEVIEIGYGGNCLARWGDKCGKWENSLVANIT
ncbi:MAG: 2-hydroxyglutaryl-CoA dehydratase [Clostridia bacterium]|nr:2-hydroxyglutaryl-CoA dehydratase [Clostridia bacterium]